MQCNHRDPWKWKRDPDVQNDVLWKGFAFTIAGFEGEGRGHKPSHLVFLEAGESKRMNSSLTPERQPCWHLSHSSLTLVWTSGLENSERIKLCCFQSQVYGNLLRQQREIDIATQSFNSTPMLLESIPSWSRSPL